MTEQQHGGGGSSLDGLLLKIIGPLFAAAIGALVGWLPGVLSAIGPALLAVLTTAGGLARLAFSVMYKRSLGVLAASAEPKGTR